jgi:CheY-like chemotaxis protein
MFTPLTILIVEDCSLSNRLIVGHLKRYFHDIGYELHTAKTLAEAKQYWHKPKTIDLAFVDCLLPDGRTTHGFLQSMRLRHPETILFATSSSEYYFSQQMQFCDCGLMKGKFFTFSGFAREIILGHARRLDALYP